MPGLIERYRESLPFAPEDPVVSLGEGSTPHVLAERLSERAGAEVWLKIEGANPTGSFKDRGMTCAVSAAVREGAEALVCASTGNTAASAAAYAARGGLAGVVIVPEGKIATGKLAQALMHGARVIALRGNFDQALELVRELAKRRPIALVNSVNPFRLEGQKTASLRDPRRAGGDRRAVHPGRQRGQRDRLLEGLHRARLAAAHARLPGRGRGAARARRAGRGARDGGERDPDRQPGPLGGGARRLHELARARPRRHRRADPRRLPLPGPRGGRLLRARVGGRRGRPAGQRRRGRRADRLRAHRPRPQGPADRARPRGLGRALRARHRRRRARHRR